MNERKIIDQSLRTFFLNAFRISVGNISQAYYFFKTVRNQQKAAKKRNLIKEEGINVPPIMIFSITNQCNLRCKGCYHWAIREDVKEEMSVEKMREVVSEASDLGISFMVLAGGEPFVRKEIIDITRDFPNIIFLVFTNGMLIDSSMIAKMKKQRNLVPVISIEGYENDTDNRRGIGVYEKVKNVMKELKKNKIFFSLSITLTSENYYTVMTEEYIDRIYDLGGRLFFFIEYTPIKENTEYLLLTAEQRDKVMSKVKKFRNKYKALFISVPGDEEEIGGCLSAGRGFVHVSASGDVEPCPFAPYSDTNLREHSLKEALKSEFLKSIRESSEHLTETEDGCALWVKREWVKSMMNRGEIV